mgnify:CR=1 FL=1
MKLFLLVLTGGTEIGIDGPFSSEEERLAAAKNIFREGRPDQGDNVFQLSIEDDDPSVAEYIDGDLEEDDDEE